MSYSELISKQTWYEELEYNHNPFSIKPIHSKEILGRESVIEKINTTIKEKSICIIHGTYGSGKTTFLKRIIEEFKGKRKVVYFSCNRLTQQLDVHKLLTERTLLSKLFNIKAKNMILLLDEADFLTEEDFKQIYTHYKKSYFKSVIFITHNIRKFKLPAPLKKEIGKNTFSFSKLALADAISIVRSRFEHNNLLPDEVIENLYKQSSSMRQFLKNCELFVKFLVDKNRKRGSIKDIKKALE